jgi:TPR repeat protein
MYDKGEGVTRDLARAVSLYQQACDGGEALGCLNLGVSRATADSLFDLAMRASEAGDDSTLHSTAEPALQTYRALEVLDLDTHFHVGLLGLATGDTALARARADTIEAAVPDHLLATILRTVLARLRGDTASVTRLSLDFLDGYDREMATGRAEYQAHRNSIEVRRREADDETAAHQLRQACNGGDAEGCYNLGLIHRTGEGVPQDDARAASLYEQACNGGHAPGCNNLGVMYETGEGVSQDDARATSLFERACEDGSAQGCDNVGIMQRRADAARLQAAHLQAAARLQEDCDSGIATACHDLGLRYSEGQGVPQDHSRAAALYEQACNGGEAEGCYSLGVMYDVGLGVPKDEARAASLFRKACDGGVSVACR